MYILEWRGLRGLSFTKQFSDATGRHDAELIMRELVEEGAAERGLEEEVRIVRSSMASCCCCRDCENERRNSATPYYGFRE